jgi:hypothetical protein
MRNAKTEIGDAYFGKKMPSKFIEKSHIFFMSLPVLHYCEKSEVIRQEICPASCGNCPNKEKMATSKEKNEDLDEQCMDKSSFCARLASTNNREHCFGLMGKLFCRKTCGNCI